MVQFLVQCEEKNGVFRRTKDTEDSGLWVEKFKKAHDVGIVVLMLNYRRMAGLMDLSSAEKIDDVVLVAVQN